MQAILLLLWIAQIADAMAQVLPSILDYTQLPSCTRTCKPLETAELNCIPPAAPISNQATYNDCLCQSEYLPNLHANGEICHEVCDNKDDMVIYHYYNTLCVTLQSIPTSTPTPSITPRASTTAEPSATATPSPINDHQDRPKGQGASFQRTWKYLLIAGILICALLFTIFGITCYCRRTRRTSDPERSHRLDRMIPLKIVASESRERLRPNEETAWPLQPPSTARLRAYDSRSHSNSSLNTPLPPLPPLPPTSGFGNSLGGTQERSLRCSLVEMERLITERIRTTGRPGLPLRATPKIRR